MAQFQIGSLDIFFISFDEPWADDFFADLCRKAPHAQRVHGVVGHDAAIKECARRSTTERFFTVDADCLLEPKALTVCLDDTSMPDAVYSFSGLNLLNGLAYGNGGPMCWPRSTALSMRTHAAALDEKSSLDFCWAVRTYIVDCVAATVHITMTPYHAFRAGYREAIKMTLIDGEKRDSLGEVKKLSTISNWSRLLMWTSVGMDVLNGEWAIYGARRSLHDVWVNDMSPSRINDYHLLSDYWQDVRDVAPHSAGVRLGAELNERFDLGIRDLDSGTSSWIKTIYVNRSPSGLMTDYDRLMRGPKAPVVSGAPAASGGPPTRRLLG